MQKPRRTCWLARKRGMVTCDKSYLRHTKQNKKLFHTRLETFLCGKNQVLWTICKLHSAMFRGWTPGGKPKCRFWHFWDSRSWDHWLDSYENLNMVFWKQFSKILNFAHWKKWMLLLFHRNGHFGRLWLPGSYKLSSRGQLYVGGFLRYALTTLPYMDNAVFIGENSSRSCSVEC